MTQEETTSRLLRLRPGALAWTDVEDRIIALDVESSEYVELNPTAACLLRTLEKGADQAGLVAALEHEFEVEREIASEGVRAFLALSGERGWLAE